MSVVLPLDPAPRVDVYQEQASNIAKLLTWIASNKGEHVRDALLRRELITAIKYLRDAHGVGLRTAKSVIDLLLEVSV